MMCPKCGGEANRVGWYDNINSDTRDRGAAYHASKGHPLGLILLGLGVVAKTVASTMFRCPNCHHQWRQWF
jgi:hypothetical protein